jgi:PncC family amidohydrolase
MIMSKLYEILLSRGLTIGIAESCTGGLISDTITDVPGSSQYFMMGMVTYSDESKMSLLGVRESTLIDHGAVSAPVAAEMAEGIRKLARADMGISATGIAGPGGATEEKPVGLVHFALSFGGKVVNDSRVFQGDRRSVKRQATEHALEMILEAIV